MTHHIKHPKNWSLVNALHDHLWKTFPMDAFDFIPTESEVAPEYSGTTLPADPTFVVFRGDQPTVAYFDDVSLAVQAFLSGQHAADTTEEASVEDAVVRVA